MQPTFNISLPTSVKKWVQAQVAKGGYETADEFLLDMIKREKARDQVEGGVAQAREKIDQILLESLAEESTPMTAKDWDKIRAAGRRRFAGKHKR
jgi:antitoxin ParD1/3/4